MMKISVIIPTLNESETISELIHFIRTNGGSTVAEIIVVDADSKDNTAQAALNMDATVLHSEMASRASQMNQGSRAATGDILYFIHADVRLVNSFADDIIQAIHEGFEAGCYRYAFNSSSKLLSINSFFTRFNALMCRGGDQTLFITKKLFTALKGFDEYYTIMEDYDIIRRIRTQSQFKVIPKRILVSARKYETNSWLRVQLANFTAFMMYYLRQSPSQIRSAYKRMLNYR
jgi:rSAM/selenodomain-associated transferase 2